mmetsp:Transcript_8778/g.26395  ORF Transcript_8778/g.26395 Transcript_8778/m.26395 type:complete len:284 (+) Transcript_8778:194-1045(+)
MRALLWFAAGAHALRFSVPRKITAASKRGPPPRPAAAGWEPPPPQKPGRPPYALSDLERPKYRGYLMGALHKTGAWYALSAAYVAAAAQQLRGTPGWNLALRVALVGASSLSVWVSDGYHNPDLRTGPRSGVSEAKELGWLRLDYVTISLILSTNYWLWAHNILQLGVVGGGLKTLAVASAAATACVAGTAALVLPRYFGHLIIKVLIGTQFVGFLGRLVTAALTSPSPACSAIYAAYIPGFITYASKFPRDPTWGYHEYFHSSVLLGHLTSMGFDLKLLGLF